MASDVVAAGKDLRAVMGTWDHQAFGNDDACDWAADLFKLPDSSGVFFFRADKLRFIASSLKAPGWGDDQSTIAAAEVVAALLGRPCPQIAKPDGYTEELAAWLLTTKVAVSAELRERAAAAVRAILTASDLASGWDETGKPEWRLAAEDLHHRLR